MVLFAWGKAYMFLSTDGDLQQELLFIYLFIIIQNYLSFTTMDIFALYLFEFFGFVMYVE